MLHVSILKDEQTLTACLGRCVYRTVIRLNTSVITLGSGYVNVNVVELIAALYQE